MPNYEITPGDYTNVKYWSVTNETGHLRIRPGTIPWRAILILELAWFGLAGLLWWAVSGPDAFGQVLGSAIVVSLALCAVACAVIPVAQVRRESAKGDILIYEADSELLKLPRQRLVLKRSQIIEFRVLQEYVPPEPGTISLVPKRRTRGSTGAAELQVVYRNPGDGTCTLLRAYGSHMFRDVIGALKKACIAKVVLAQQQPKKIQWEVIEA